METKTFNSGLRIPAARGRIAVPARGAARAQNMALDSAAVQPAVTALPEAKPRPATNKPQAQRVTFDMMTQQTASVRPVTPVSPPVVAPITPTPVKVPQPASAIQPQPQLQTAVQIAAEQPAAVMPAPVNFAGASVSAVPMIQIAPMQEVAVTNHKPKKKLNFDVKKHANMVKSGLKKVNATKIKDVSKIAVSKVKNARIPNINVRPSDMVRYAVVAVVLIISGYLAYDTWTTNQQAKDIFSQSAAATTSATGVADGTTATNAEPVYTVAPDMPKYLSIPKIGVNNARVEQVGLLANNKVDTPKDLNNVAWYDGSVKPGEAGAAFINGHINDVGAGGIFDGLKNVATGDKVIIERGDGTKLNYEVVDAVTVPTSSIDMNSVFQVHGGGDQGVNLMTCAGTYNFNTMTYSHRVIVYAKRI